jgi:hypothetical protein
MDWNCQAVEEFGRAPRLVGSKLARFPKSSIYSGQLPVTPEPNGDLISMLVYTSCINFEPAEGPLQIVQLIARWMGTKGRSFVDPLRLAEGVRDLVLRDGQHVHSRSNGFSDGTIGHPFLFCAQFSHSDDKVSGRRWVTEIGLRQERSGEPVECTFLLKTDEVSARVIAPIQVTRPRLVADLVEECSPSAKTPGVKIKILDEISATAFLVEVEHEERTCPLVVVSPSRNGSYMVTPARLRSLLVGIADVVDVPMGADTYTIEEKVGRRYSAWAGAINVIFSPRRGAKSTYCETVLFRPIQLEDMVNDGKNIESELLAAITHRTNLPYSWRHISLETVSQARLRAQLASSIASARKSGEVEEYVALLEAADAELGAKEKEVLKFRLDLDERNSEVRKLQADIDGLKHALSGRESSQDVTVDEISTLSPLRNAVAAVIDGEPKIEQSLTIVSTLFPDRIVVLESARNSARESDLGGFRHGKKAFELIWKLANGYWLSLSDGGGDQQAKIVFGNNAYAQNEGEALSKEGKRRRTFGYRGRDLLMEKHLKIGVKDSVAETLRIHFEWLADEKRLLIGHCGKHLDF